MITGTFPDFTNSQSQPFSYKDAVCHLIHYSLRFPLEWPLHMARTVKQKRE